MKEIFKERLGFLYSQIVFTKLEFKILNDFITRENNIKYPEFMLVIFEGMKTSLLMKLAKILEQDSKNDSISIYYIFNTILSCGDINRKNKELTKYIYEKREELDKEYSQYFEVLKNIRDKRIAHYDKTIEKESNIQNIQDEIGGLKEMENLITNISNSLVYIYKEIFDENMDESSYENILQTNLMSQINSINNSI